MEIEEKRKVLIDVLDSIYEDVLKSNPYRIETNKISDIIFSIKSNSNNDFVSISDCPDNVEYSRSNNRIKTSFQRYVRRVLNFDYYKITDFSLDYLGKKVRIKLSDLDNNIEILTGDQISEFYHNIKSNDNLHSCMTGCNSDKTKIYSLNPDKVALVLYKENDKPKARALLWTTDDGTKILDRVYPTNSSFEQMALVEWGKKNNFVVKSDDEYLQKKLITLKHNNVFPYFDSFYYGKFIDKTNLLKLGTDYFRGYDHIFKSTDGSYQYLGRCAICNKINYNSFIYIGENPVSKERYICDLCKKDNLEHCENCSRVALKQSLYSVKKGKETLKYCIYCAEKFIPKCNLCNKLIRGSKYKIEKDGFEKIVCKDCADNFFTCFYCDKNFENSKKEKIIKNGKFYCSERCSKRYQQFRKL